MGRGRNWTKWLAVLVTLTLVNFAYGVESEDYYESLKDDDEVRKTDVKESVTEYPNGVNVIPGQADVHYPIYAKIPKSDFSCLGRPTGFYADTELRCQVWHICDESGTQQSFLCTNGTTYSQEKRVCDWWYNVNCDPEDVNRNYEQNRDLYKGPPSKSQDVVTYAEENNNDLPTQRKLTEQQQKQQPQTHNRPTYDQQKQQQSQQQNKRPSANEQRPSENLSRYTEPEEYQQRQQSQRNPVTSQNNYNNNRPQQQQYRNSAPTQPTPVPEKKRVIVLRLPGPLPPGATIPPHVLREYAESVLAAERAGKTPPTGLPTRSQARQVNSNQHQEAPRPNPVTQAPTQRPQPKPQQQNPPQSQAPAPLKPIVSAPFKPVLPYTPRPFSAFLEAASKYNGQSRPLQQPIGTPAPAPQHQNSRPSETRPNPQQYEQRTTVTSRQSYDDSRRTSPAPQKQSYEEPRKSSPTPSQENQHRQPQSQQPNKQPENQYRQPENSQKSSQSQQNRPAENQYRPSESQQRQPQQSHQNRESEHQNRQPESQHQNRQPENQNRKQEATNQHRQAENQQRQPQSQNRQQEQQNRQEVQNQQRQSQSQNRQAENQHNQNRQPENQQNRQQAESQNRNRQPEPQSQYRQPEEQYTAKPKPAPVNTEKKAQYKALPADPHKKFRHSTPRKHTNVKFAPKGQSSSEDFEDERQFPEESRRPAYPFQFNNFQPVPHISSEEPSQAPPKSPKVSKAEIHAQKNPISAQDKPRRRNQATLKESFVPLEEYQQTPAVQIRTTQAPIEDPVVHRLVVVARQGLKIKDPRGQEETIPAISTTRPEKVQDYRRQRYESVKVPSVQIQTTQATVISTSSEATSTTSRSYSTTTPATQFPTSSEETSRHSGGTRKVIKVKKLRTSTTENTRATEDLGFDVYGRNADEDEEEELIRAAQQYQEASEHYGKRRRPSNST